MKNPLHLTSFIDTCAVCVFQCTCLNQKTLPRWILNMGISLCFLWKNKCKQILKRDEIYGTIFTQNSLSQFYHPLQAMQFLRIDLSIHPSVCIIFFVGWLLSSHTKSCSTKRLVQMSICNEYKFEHVCGERKLQLPTLIFSSLLSEWHPPSLAASISTLTCSAHTVCKVNITRDIIKKRQTT